MAGLIADSILIILLLGEPNGYVYPGDGSEWVILCACDSNGIRQGRRRSDPSGSERPPCRRSRLLSTANAVYEQIFGSACLRALLYQAARSDVGH